MDPTILGLKFFVQGLFLDQKVFGPYFLWKKITTTTTTILIGFDIIEINIVFVFFVGKK